MTGSTCSLRPEPKIEASWKPCTFSTRAAERPPPLGVNAMVPANPTMPYKKFCASCNELREASELMNGSNKFREHKRGLAMRKSFAVLSVGAFLVSGLPNQASAAYWESLPPSWRKHQTAAAPSMLAPPSGVLTTGSINNAPRRPAHRQPRPAGEKF